MKSRIGFGHYLMELVLVTGSQGFGGIRLKSAGWNQALAGFISSRALFWTKILFSDSFRVPVRPDQNVRVVRSVEYFFKRLQQSRISMCRMIEMLSGWTRFVNEMFFWVVSVLFFSFPDFEILTSNFRLIKERIWTNFQKYTLPVIGEWSVQRFNAR